MLAFKHTFFLACTVTPFGPSTQKFLWTDLTGTKRLHFSCKIPAMNNCLFTYSTRSPTTRIQDARYLPRALCQLLYSWRWGQATVGFESVAFVLVGNYACEGVDNIWSTERGKQQDHNPNRAHYSLYRHIFIAFWRSCPMWVESLPAETDTLDRQHFPSTRKQRHDITADIPDDSNILYKGMSAWVLVFPGYKTHVSYERVQDRQLQKAIQGVSQQLWVPQMNKVAFYSLPNLTKEKEERTPSRLLKTSPTHRLYYLVGGINTTLADVRQQTFDACEFEKPREKEETHGLPSCPVV